MKTKDLIKETALKLMNSRGMPNVTLRHVAEELGKSYGNITYHFPNKEKLVEAIYVDMIHEMSMLSAAFGKEADLLQQLLKAPEYTFDLSLKYLFLYKDYVEIRRSFKALSKRVDRENKDRMNLFRHLLILLRDQGVIRKEFDDEALDRLMKTSGYVRTMFFVELPDRSVSGARMRQEYVKAVNSVLLPYLSPKFFKMANS